MGQAGAAGGQGGATRKLALALVVLSFADAGHGNSAESPSAPGSAASIAGCWDLVVKTAFLHPNLRGRFSFTVEGSSLRGTVSVHGNQSEVRDGTIDGARIGFRVELRDERAQFEGELHGAELRGTMTKSSQRLSWTATRCLFKQSDRGE